MFRKINEDGRAASNACAKLNGFRFKFIYIFKKNTGRGSL